MKDINTLLEKIKKFRDERDWMQFHNHKDMAISLLLEAGEVLEHFQWKTAAEIEEYGQTHKNEIADELGDVLIYLAELADNLGIDLVDAALQKIEKNEQKYPIEKAKGKYAKYTKL